MTKVESIKYLALGPSGCGKTCMMITLINNKFPTEYVPTYFDNTEIMTNVDDQLIRLELWDVFAGRSPEYRRVRQLSYPGGDIFLLCISVDYHAAMQYAEDDYLPDIKKHALEAPIVVVMNKTDLRDDAVMMEKLMKDKRKIITQQEGKAWADKIGAVGYFECSALKGEGLKEMYLATSRLAISEKKQRVNSKKSAKKETGCVIL